MIEVYCIINGQPNALGYYYACILIFRNISYWYINIVYCLKKKLLKRKNLKGCV